MERLDLKKRWKALYTASAREPGLVEVPRLRYLMIDGRGDPNRAASFQEAVEALFALSYSLKFMIKKSPGGIDYGVMPLEGVWWAQDMEDFRRGGSRDSWQWTLMILQPEAVTPELTEAARAKAGAGKDLPGLGGVRLAESEDGLSAQLLHVGPFSAEGPTVQRLHGFIADRGLSLRGRHREIYLSDFRRTQPERLRTIIRQPVGRD